MKRSVDGMGIVSSGMGENEFAFTWEIPNLPLILEDDSLITSQRIEYRAGDRISQSSKWKLYLTVETPEQSQTKWLGIYCQVLEPPIFPHAHLYSRAEFVFRDDKGKKLGDADTNLLESTITLGGPWGVPKAIGVPKNGSVKCLQIDVNFQLYRPSKRNYNLPGQPALKFGKEDLPAIARKDLAGLLQESAVTIASAFRSWGEDDNIKFVSCDKKEFSLPRGILEARAPAFATYLEAATPTSDGDYPLPGITGKALEILISFIYAGELPKDWKGQGEVAVELVYAAGKYRIENLLKLLDEILGNSCVLGNVLPLLILTNKYSLKRAEEGLLKFVREKGTGSAKTFLKMITGEHDYFFARTFPAFQSKSCGVVTLETGVDVEEQSFVWEIKNFPVLAMKDSLVNSQFLTFSAGEKINQLSEWRLHLKVNVKAGKRTVWIYYAVKELPTTTKAYLKSKMYLLIKDNEGKSILNMRLEMKDIEEFLEDGRVVRGYGRPLNMLDLNKTPLPQHLEIHVCFELLSPAEPTTGPISKEVQSILNKFHDSSTAACRTELVGMARTGGSGGGDIKILSNDRKEFTVSPGILGARSPVFEAMMRSDMTETNDGIIRISDMTGASLKVLLHFIYTGELLPAWKNGDVIVELTNGAAMYQLTDLLRFLDQALGKICDLDSVAPLLTLATQLSLTTAEKELLKFARESGTSCIENFSQIVKSVSGLN